MKGLTETFSNFVTFQAPEKGAGGHDTPLTAVFNVGKVWSNEKLHVDAGSFTTRMDTGTRDAMYYLIIHTEGLGIRACLPGRNELA